SLATEHGVQIGYEAIESIDMRRLARRTTVPALIVDVRSNAEGGKCIRTMPMPLGVLSESVNNNQRRARLARHDVEIATRLQPAARFGGSYRGHLDTRPRNHRTQSGLLRDPRRPAARRRRSRSGPCRTTGRVESCPPRAARR